MGWIAMLALLVVALCVFAFFKKDPVAPRPYILNTNLPSVVIVTNPCAHLSAVSNGLTIQINISIQDALRMITNHALSIGTNVTNYADSTASSVSNYIISPALTNNVVYYGWQTMTQTTAMNLATNNRPSSTFYYKIEDVVDWTDNLCIVHVLKAERRMVGGRAFVCIEPDYYLARFSMVKECKKYKGLEGWLKMEIRPSFDSWSNITRIIEYPVTDP